MSRKKLEQLITGRPDLVERLLMVAEGPPDDENKVASPFDAYRHLAPLLSGFNEERLAVLAVTRRHRFLACEVLTHGTDAFTIVDPKQIYRWALLQRRGGAKAIILGHNHPSGDTTPSKQDEQVTQRVVAAGRVLGIPLLDHLVVGRGSYTSLAELGMLEAYGPDTPLVTM